MARWGGRRDSRAPRNWDWRGQMWDSNGSLVRRSGRNLSELAVAGRNSAEDRRGGNLLNNSDRNRATLKIVAMAILRGECTTRATSSGGRVSFQLHYGRGR